MAQGEALDRRRSGNPRVDRVDAWTTDQSIAHMPIKKSYNGHDSITGGVSDASDQDPKAEIKSVGSSFKGFI